MVMTSEEIVRDYLQARNKSKQIKILADLNLTTQAEIKKVLAEEGAEAHKRPRKRPAAQMKNDTAERAKGPETEIYGQIEGILAALPENMGEKARWAAGKLAAELFAEYLMVRLGLQEGRHGQNGHWEGTPERDSGKTAGE